MLFAANPFETNIAGARPDGEGLEPAAAELLDDHPPAEPVHGLRRLLGAVRVLRRRAGHGPARQRVDRRDAQVDAVRASCSCRSATCSACCWAYEELGWGGYWAWDPVENAACLPWFTAAAYVHSTMIQERRNMLKVWNVFLICLTFFLTIFGTFLTRSGIITSVHSFAQSDIGTYFVYFMGVIAGARRGSSSGACRCCAPKVRDRSRRQPRGHVRGQQLGAARRHDLHLGRHHVPEASASSGTRARHGRPALLQSLDGARSASIIFALMGLAPCSVGARPASVSLKKAFRAPVAAMLVTVVLHFALGSSLGYPAIVPRDAFYPGASASDPARGIALPGVTIALLRLQRRGDRPGVQRGVNARRRGRRRSAAKPEGVLSALFKLVDKNRRRYGGYIVHLGIVSACSSASSARPGTSIARRRWYRADHYRIGDYDLHYLGTRMCPGNPKCSAEEQADIEQAHAVRRHSSHTGGQGKGFVHPAKFFYQSQPDGPTTEVSMMRSPARGPVHGGRHDRSPVASAPPSNST